MRISNELISFTGRMERSAYRHRFVIMMFVNLFSLCFGTDKKASQIISSTMLVVSLISCISILSMVVRRLRDIKLSPLWAIPLSLLHILVFYIVGIILCFKKGKYDE